MKNISEKVKLARHYKQVSADNDYEQLDFKKNSYRVFHATNLYLLV